MRIKEYVQVIGNTRSVPSNTWTKFNYKSTHEGVLAFDNANSRFEVLEDGDYSACCYCNWVTNPNGIRQVAIRVGDTAPPNDWLPPPDGGSMMTVTGTGDGKPLDQNMQGQILHLSAGDFITLWYWQNSGVNLTVNDNNWFEIKHHVD